MVVVAQQLVAGDRRITEDEHRLRRHVAVQPEDEVAAPSVGIQHSAGSGVLDQEIGGLDREIPGDQLPVDALHQTGNAGEGDHADQRQHHDDVRDERGGRRLRHPQRPPPGEALAPLLRIVGEGRHRHQHEQRQVANRMEREAEPDQQQQELAQLDAARQRQAADDQENHRLESPDLRHLEVGRKPFDDQPLLLRAAPGLEGIEVDVPTVGVEDGNPDRCTKDDGHGTQPGQGHCSRAAQKVSHPLHQQRDPEDGVTQDEAGVEVDPDEHDGREEIERAAAPLAEALDPQIGKRAQREGDHLDSRPPNRIRRRHAEGQGESRDHEVDPTIDGEVDEQESGGGHRPQRQADQRQPSGGIEQREDDLAQPLVGDPAVVVDGEGVEVLVRHGVVAQDPVAGGEVPPEVGVGHRLDRGDQHGQEDGDGKEMRQVEPAHGSGQPAVRAWHERGRD